MSLTFKRMYIDIPAETHERLVSEAAVRGMSQKGLVALLIENECTPSKTVTRKKRAHRSKK